ncbi:hypothetical protein ACTFIY_004510 [Dictyostelium cf. discoideum]
MKILEIYDKQIAEKEGNIFIFISKWIISVDHKNIGTMYTNFSILAGIVGTLLSLVIRMELSTGNMLDGDLQQYNVIVTAHGLIMIFFVVMPAMLGGFANWFLPIMVGAPDVAFPRLNNISLWLIIVSFFLLLTSSCVGIGAGTGDFNVIHPESKIWFNEWFVGLTDGVGSFSLLKSNGKISLTFKLSQNVRNPHHIKEILIPIFNEHLLVTNKEWDYLKFKKGLNAKITSNKEQLPELLLLEKPREYKSSFWEQKKSLTKPWTLGFIEAEGSLLYCKERYKWICAWIWNYTERRGTYTTNSRAIENIIKYSENKLMGMKAIECRIWSRSYRKYKGNSKKLKELQELIRKMKEKMKITQDEGIVRTIREVIESNDNTDTKV